MKSFRWLLNQFRLAWISLISKIKSLFQSNKHTSSNNGQNASNGNDHDGNTRKTNVENKIKTQDNEIDAEDEQDVWYDALEEQKSGEKERNLDEEEFFDVTEDFGEQEVSVNRERYESNKFYSTKDFRKVEKFIDHSKTFAVAIFEHSVDKASGHFNDSNCQLASLQLSDDRKSRACTLSFESRQSNIKISSDHMRLYMPFYFESKKQESIEFLF